ncbi:MAG TPA: helix-turn-helix domain-containing protein [Solirubrobacteraceae bacterium]|nr:helix-turn-helix domain-containing protein [Solirubrobacteraceae bacterium]
MPDIGDTLRETRMRRRIDITEVEAATKIRAKYLRALENEEWDLLPGPTFVKTFLRTYAEYLELDPKILVEEYKQRFDRPGPQDLLPFSPQRAGRRQRRAPVIPPVAIVAACVLLLIGALAALGSLGGSEDELAPEEEVVATPTPRAQERGRERRERRRPAAPTRVRLQIVPTGTVNVCLVTGSGRVLIPSQNLEAGASTRTFRAKRLRVTFGNGQAVMRLGGRRVDVPDRTDAVGYDLRPGRAPRELPADQRPTCAS